jgi:catechol 2,3-dioxygenase-like lactoylglutathione lyase family enzyme
MSASGIGEISLVTVTSSDQDRSIKFYEELLGFARRGRSGGRGRGGRDICACGRRVLAAVP